MPNARRSPPKVNRGRLKVLKRGGKLKGAAAAQGVGGGKRKGKKKMKAFKAKPTPAPEPMLEAEPLMGGGIPGPFGVHQPFVGWKMALRDDLRRSFVSHRKEAFTAAVLKGWWLELIDKVRWKRPQTDEWVLPRSAAWLTSTGCTCQYEYGGLKFPPLQMEPWFMEITEKVCRTCGLKDRPDACNANYYDGGTQAVGWHSDDEPLFDALRNDVLIVSLSLGASRQFQLHPKDKPTEFTTVTLENGDLCTMEGLCQKHYRHRVPREKEVKAPRINLTWRWILRHSSDCPLIGRM